MQVVHLMHMFRLGVEFASTPHGYVVHSPHPVANSWNTTQATGFWYKVGAPWLVVRRHAGMESAGCTGMQPAGSMGIFGVRCQLRQRTASAHYLQPHHGMAKLCPSRVLLCRACPCNSCMVDCKQRILVACRARLLPSPWCGMCLFISFSIPGRPAAEEVVC